MVIARVFAQRPAFASRVSQNSTGFGLAMYPTRGEAPSLAKPMLVSHIHLRAPPKGTRPKCSRVGRHYQADVPQALLGDDEREADLAFDDPRAGTIVLDPHSPGEAGASGLAAAVWRCAQREDHG